MREHYRAIYFYLFSFFFLKKSWANKWHSKLIEDQEKLANGVAESGLGRGFPNFLPLLLHEF